MNPDEITIEFEADRPKGGQWHCGPNLFWVTVTHLPTGIMVKQYGRLQHKAREQALACLEMLVSEARL